MKNETCNALAVTKVTFSDIREVAKFAFEKGNLKEFHISHKVTSCYSQRKTTYLQVILQVSGKYFPKTSRFP